MSFRGGYRATYIGLFGDDVVRLDAALRDWRQVVYRRYPESRTWEGWAELLARHGAVCQ